MIHDIYSIEYSTSIEQNLAAPPSPFLNFLLFSILDEKPPFKLFFSFTRLFPCF